MRTLQALLPCLESMKRRTDQGLVSSRVRLGGPASAYSFGDTLCPLLPGVRWPEGSDRALPEHMRTLQALLPRPQHLKRARVPLGFIVEVRRLRCRAIPAREAMKTYLLSAQDLDSLPVYKVCCRAHGKPDAGLGALLPRTV